MARARRSAARVRRRGRPASALPQLRRRRRRTRLRVGRRLQWRDRRGRRPVRDHDARRAADVDRARLPRTRARTRDARHRDRCARHPRVVRRYARGRRGLAARRRRARRAREAGGDPVRGRDRLAAPAAAVRRRRSRAAARARHRGARRPAGGRRAPAGPPVHRSRLPCARADAERRTRPLAGEAEGRPALPRAAPRPARAVGQPGRRLRALARGTRAPGHAALLFAAVVHAHAPGRASADAAGPFPRLPALARSPAGRRAAVASTSRRPIRTRNRGSRRDRFPRAATSRRW